MKLLGKSAVILAAAAAMLAATHYEAVFSSLAAGAPEAGRAPGHDAFVNDGGHLDSLPPGFIPSGAAWDSVFNAYWR